MTILDTILEQGHYDPQDEIHRSIIAYAYIPVLEREMHLFATSWNNHRIRFQKDAILLDGVPEHFYSFLEKYGLERCSLSVSEVAGDQTTAGGRTMRRTNILKMTLRTDALNR